jgi:hypothetical protein
MIAAEKELEGAGGAKPAAASGATAGLAPLKHKDLTGFPEFPAGTKSSVARVLT